MINSGSLEPKTEPLNRAVGYSYFDFSTGKIDLKTNKATTFMGSDNGTSGGWNSSSAENLLKFSLALQQNKLLNPKYTKMVLSEKVQTNFGIAKYGSGAIIETISGVRIVGHGGDAPGVSTAVDIYPESGYTVIVLANRDQSIASAVATKIRLMLIGKANTTKLK